MSRLSGRSRSGRGSWLGLLLLLRGGGADGRVGNHALIVPWRGGQIRGGRGCVEFLRGGRFVVPPGCVASKGRVLLLLLLDCVTPATPGTAVLPLVATLPVEAVATVLGPRPVVGGGSV